MVVTDRVEEVRSALATGTASLLFDEAAPTGVPLDRSVRICVASYEVVGPTKNGGIGTANTSLAELLALAGHDVTLLYTGWQPLDDTTRSRWARHYRQRGVEFLETAPRDSAGGRHAAFQPGPRLRGLPLVAGARGASPLVNT